MNLMWGDETGFEDCFPDSLYSSKVFSMAMRIRRAMKAAFIFGLAWSAVAVLSWSLLRRVDARAAVLIFDKTSPLVVILILLTPPLVGGLLANTTTHREYNRRRINLPFAPVAQFWGRADPSTPRPLRTSIAMAGVTALFILIQDLARDFIVVQWLAGLIWLRCYLSAWQRLTLLWQTLVCVSAAISFALIGHGLGSMNPPGYLLYALSIGTASLVPYQLTVMIGIRAATHSFHDADNMLSVSLFQNMFIAFVPLVIHRASLYEALRSGHLSFNSFATALFLFLAVLSAAFVLLVWQDAQTARRRQGRPLQMSPEPIVVAKTFSSRSSVTTGVDSLRSAQAELLFVTESQRLFPLGKAPPFGAAAVLAREGSVKDTAEQFDLRIYFSLHHSSAQAYVYDIHSDVYHVSTGWYPGTLGNVLRYRVELTQDNSIIGSGNVISVAPERPAFIDLSLSSSVNGETSNTLIVFGVFVDYETLDGGEVTKRRLPSDKIYVFQHCAETSQGELLAFGQQDLSVRVAEAKLSPQYYWAENGQAQTADRRAIYQSLSAILERHREAAGFLR
jgi:hypothetical protein